MSYFDKIITDWERRIERSASEITIATLDETIKEWEKVISVFEDSSKRESNQFNKVEKRVKINRRKELVSRLKELRELAAQKNEKNILPADCLDRLYKLTDKYTKWGVHETFKKAYECEACQFEIADKERKKIGSYRTLMNRVKEHYPEIYERAKAK